MGSWISLFRGNDKENALKGTKLLWMIRSLRRTLWKDSKSLWLFSLSCNKIGESFVLLAPESRSILRLEGSTHGSFAFGRYLLGLCQPGPA